MSYKREEIKKVLPYKEPFLFLDEVTEIGDDEISGYYQTSEKDYYFEGHFVDFKIMPGVLIVEALAQLSTFHLRQKRVKNHQDYHFLAYKVRGVEFLEPIFPGDKIELWAKILNFIEIDENRKIANILAKAFVEKRLKCEARFSVFIIKKSEFFPKK
jgi:3-hydroxyacyl-[acyl-carrier-protein] dehydratase